MSPMGMAGTMQPGMNPMMFGGMNPMMMGMMNPMMMGMNPAMMGMMQPGMNPMMMTASQPCGALVGSARPPVPDTALIEPVDLRVKALCRDFGIDDQIAKKLHDAMKDREDYDDDIQALYQVIERATAKGKKALEVMLTKIREIKAGRFAGKDLLDKDIWWFAEKYNLDDRVLNRLIETLKKRKSTKTQDLKALDERLGNSAQPTGLGLLVRLLEGLEETGRLPSPPRRLGGSGVFHPTGTFLHPSSTSHRGNRDSTDDRDHDRGRRESDRRRSRSRGRR